MADEPQTPRALADPQDPLPEASWLWRRVFTFVCLGLAFGLTIGLAVALNRIVGNVVGRIDTMSAVNVAQITVVAIQAMLDMFKMMFYVTMLVITYYMVAPSAEQIVKVIQTAGLLKSGVQIGSRALFRGPDGQEEETQATVGVPPQPVVPPAVAAPSAPPEVASDEEEDVAPRSKT
jgi:hypothetical protein